LLRFFLHQRTFYVRTDRKDEVMPKADTEKNSAVILGDLERAQEPREIARLLRDFEFTEADIAEGTDSENRSVRRWKGADPGASAAEHLAEIRNVVVRLSRSGVLTDRGIVFWMRHPNRLLDDFSPLSAIGAGGFRSARDAALCFADTERDFETPLPDTVRKKLEDADRAKRDESDAELASRELEVVS
jgi:hypothetical protein